MNATNVTGGTMSDTERRLQERLLLERRVEGDHLALDDATLRAALDGSRALTAGERGALQASPLTARRLRQLALDRRAAATGMNAWRGSRGMLRAASGGGAAPEPVRTDDGWWTLHFIVADGAWRTILQLAPAAPFAGGLLAARARVTVLDGAGSTLLQGVLDADGECEADWPRREAPHAWVQAHGATFSVAPA
jgi:hypothetical protein